jgi:hypothetical protein
MLKIIFFLKHPTFHTMVSVVTKLAQLISYLFLRHFLILLFYGLNDAFPRLLVVTFSYAVVGDARWKFIMLMTTGALLIFFNPAYL